MDKDDASSWGEQKDCAGTGLLQWQRDRIPGIERIRKKEETAEAGFFPLRSLLILVVVRCAFIAAFSRIFEVHDQRVRERERERDGEIRNAEK